MNLSPVVIDSEAELYVLTDEPFSVKLSRYFCATNSIYIPPVYCTVSLTALKYCLLGHKPLAWGNRLGTCIVLIHTSADSSQV